MPFMPCPNAVTSCPANPSPLMGGYDAETSDVVEFIGLSWGPINPPPLGWAFDNVGCFTACKTPVSQQAADIDAYNKSAACAESQWYPPEPAQEDFSEPALEQSEENMWGISDAPLM